MKRNGNLFEQAFTAQSLQQAFHDAAKSKRGRRACFEFERNLGAQIAQLHTELHSNNYQSRPYFSFVVREPKERIIYAPAFRDCVVQHAIYRAVSPIFDKTFIDQSFACRIGMGTHKAADYAQTALNKSNKDSYTLKLDIRKFFYRIDRDILLALLKRKIKDDRMLGVMQQFMDHGEPAGIPIGNLLSQLYALIYLNPLDHYIKRELKVKLYCRYVDDLVLFNLTHQQAIECRSKIIDFIATNLNLELSKSTIAKTGRGVNFVGYRTWRTKRFIRRRSLYNFRQAVKRSKPKSVISILGHARKTHSLKYLINYTREHNHAIYLQLPKTYHQRSHKTTQNA